MLSCRSLLLPRPICLLSAALPASVRGQSPVPATRAERVALYSPLADAAADYYGIPRIIVRAMIRIESDRRPDAVSSAGALGLLQVMPSTGGDYMVGADLTDAAANGVRHLYGLLLRMDLVTALAAWDAGEGAVSRRDVFGTYGETLRFVAAVLLEMERLAAGSGVNR